MCRTGVGAGSSAGADKGPDRRQSNHEWTDDQAGRRRLANTDSDGGSPVHAAADTPSKNAATSDTHCNFTPHSARSAEPRPGTLCLANDQSMPLQRYSCSSSLASMRSGPGRDKWNGLHAHRFTRVDYKWSRFELAEGRSQPVHANTNQAEPSSLTGRSTGTRFQAKFSAL